MGIDQRRGTNWCWTEANDKLTHPFIIIIIEHALRPFSLLRGYVSTEGLQ